MNDNIRRGVRTFLQAFLGVIALQALALTNDASDGVIDIDLWKRVLLSAVAAGLVGFVSWAMNALEDATGKAILAPTDRKAGDAALGTGLGAK